MRLFDERNASHSASFFGYWLLMVNGYRLLVIRNA
jgi:hypothetical protein